MHTYRFKTVSTVKVEQFRVHLGIPFVSRVNKNNLTISYVVTGPESGAT